METKVEGAHPLEFVLSEGNGAISRDVVTIRSGAGKLDPGTVLGKVTADGKYVASPAASTVGIEGAETALAVLAYSVDATSADVPNAVVIDKDAEVKIPNLVYDASVDNAAKETAKQDELRAVGIKAR